MHIDIWSVSRASGETDRSLKACLFAVHLIVEESIVTHSHGDEGRYFRGIVQTVPNGYGFIAIATTTTEEGDPGHGLGDHDIYVGASDSAAELAVGLELRFRVIPNPSKGEGYWRAVEATEILNAELIPAGESAIPGLATASGGALVLHQPVSSYADEQGMKEVPEELVAVAVSNSGLASVPRNGEPMQTPQSPEEVALFLEAYLHNRYSRLAAIEGFRFSITEDTREAMDSIVAEEVEDMAMMAAASAKQVEEEYAQFRETWALLRWIYEKDLFVPGTPMHPSMVAQMIKTVQEAPDAKAKARSAEAIQRVTTFMAETQGGMGGQGGALLRPDTVLPVGTLPELFMACPVWFFYWPDQDESADMGRIWETDMGVQTGGLEYFSYLLGANQRWADTFGMFNRRLRGLPLYPADGDVIPRHVRSVIREASKVFDYVVVMTPFHEVAGKEWKDPEWHSGVDPYVVGFHRDIPDSMFVLARFCDGGVFPLFNELLADTMAFLRANYPNLIGFNAQDRGGVRQWSLTWAQATESSIANYRQRRFHADLEAWDKHRTRQENTSIMRQHPDDWSWRFQWWPSKLIEEVGSYLIDHACQMLAAFDQGQLFPWLRSEWDLPEAALPAPQDALPNPQGQLEQPNS